MTYNQPIQGVNSVSEYLASSLPWVTSSIAVTGSVTRHDFPSVTSWINIKNTSPSGVLEIGVTQYGTLFESNVFQIPASGSFSAPYRLVSLYTMATSGSVNQTYQLAAGLTGISQRDYPRIENIIGSGSTGSDLYDYSYEGTIVGEWRADRSPLFTTATRSTPVVNSGDPVGSWSDIRGTNHVSQSYSSFRPTYDPNGLAVGKPAVIFDGVDDFLSSNPVGMQTGTIFVVGKALENFIGEGDIGYPGFIKIGATYNDFTSNGIMMVYNNIYHTAFLAAPLSFRVWQDNFVQADIYNGNVVIVSWRWGATRSINSVRKNFRKDTLATSQGVYAPPNGSLGIHFAASYMSNVAKIAISHVIIYSTALDDNAMNRVERVLNYQWGGLSL